MGIPLHRWLLDEAVQQYFARKMDPELYDRTFRNAQNVASTTLSQVLKNQDSHLPTTLAELWAMSFLQSASNDRQSEASLRPEANSTSSPTKRSRGRKNQTAAGEGESWVPGPVDSFESVLRRGGFLPLPQSVENAFLVGMTTGQRMKVRQIARECGWECTAALFPPAGFQSNMEERAAALRRGDRGGPSTASTGGGGDGPLRLIPLSRRGSDFDAVGGDYVLFDRKKEEEERNVEWGSGRFSLRRLAMSREVRS